MHKRLTSWITPIVAIFCLVLFSIAIGLPSDTAGKMRIRSNGKAAIDLNLKGVTDPACLVRLDFSADSNFSGLTESFTVGPANFKQGTINFMLRAKPVDARGQALSDLYVRILVQCPDASEPVYTETLSASLQALTVTKTVTEQQFLSELTGKTLTSAFKAARPSFQSSLSGAVLAREAPVITSDLKAVVFQPSPDVVVRLGVIGSKPIRYQWYISDPASDSFQNLRASTLGLEVVNDLQGSTLILRAKLVNMTEYYNRKLKVVARNRFGQVTSSVVRLYAAPPPPPPIATFPETAETSK